MSIQEKREYMLSMIADWQQSGKSKKAYCAEHGINEAKFYYWLSRIKESDKSAVGFLTIDKASKNSDIEIIYPNGVRIKVEKDLGLLSQLIRLY
ncbi:IS66 family insertion sequence element accessory protein TnpA [Sphingobacterium sp. SYP-B4668]|uniref:IS66 family insertion sequence element accessory protein TnpA n=1 Tax=Sphingobacterium sp. SYP-B4668 TaxID=2996035 RepID=UPI0022DD0FDD|nr:IS66 family insertion sequence element accessory protein TnpB [Sphingobacterium sp. SYP-B4668]